MRDGNPIVTNDLTSLLLAVDVRSVLPQLGIPHVNLGLRLSGCGGCGGNRVCAFELEGRAYQLGTFAFNAAKDGAGGKEGERGEGEPAHRQR